MIIDLANTASSGDQTKISLRKDGITGSSISFTLSGFPSNQITITPGTTLQAGITYFIVFIKEPLRMPLEALREEYLLLVSERD